MRSMLTNILYVLHFWGVTGVKKNSASIITKESLFGTIPPQMAKCLMFLSRCVAFSLP